MTQGGSGPNDNDNDIITSVTIHSRDVFVFVRVCSGVKVAAEDTLLTPRFYVSTREKGGGGEEGGGGEILATLIR